MNINLQRAIIWYTAALLTMYLSGCGGPDLADYQPPPPPVGSVQLGTNTVYKYIDLDLGVACYHTNWSDALSCVKIEPKKGTL